MFVKSSGYDFKQSAETENPDLVRPKLELDKILLTEFMLLREVHKALSQYAF